MGSLERPERTVLVGKALEQQGKILDEQTKIMEEQFKFQRRLEAKTERERVLRVVLEVAGRVRALAQTLSRYQLSNFQDEDSRQQANRMWDRLTEAILPCSETLLTHEVGGLKQELDPRKDIESLAALEAKYHDFGLKILNVAVTPDETAF
jgi:hypothetical protein